MAMSKLGRSNEREYHYIVVFDERTNTWRVDIGREETDYPEGTIFNHATGSWEYGYQGDGEFTGNEYNLSQALWRKLAELDIEFKDRAKNRVKVDSDTYIYTIPAGDSNE